MASIKSTGKLWSCPWDIPRWRMSRTRAHLNAEARGIMRELWDECFCEGSVPDDPSQCAKIAAVTEEEMNRNWPTIRALFRLRRGRLYHAAASSIRDSVSKRNEKFRLAGQLGGLERIRRIKDLSSDASSDASSQAQARAGARSVSVSIPGVVPGLTEEENLTGVPGVLAGAERYDTAADWYWFREHYPNIPSEDRANQAFQSVVESAETGRRIRAALGQPEPWFTSQGWQDGKVHNAETWLYGRMWNGRPVQARSQTERKGAQDRMAMARERERRLGRGVV